jgi:hypothetical protein
LREVDNAPLKEAQVIDARFKIVGRKRRVLRAVWRGLLAVGAAALAGFLIPPAWMLIQTLAGYLTGR